MNSSIKNIIFDLGNTLIYFDHNYFYDGISNLEKHLSIKEFKKFISEKKLGEKLFTAKISNKDYFRILKKKFGLKIGYDDFIYIYSDIFWENSEMIKFIEKISLEKNYKLFLFSNTDPAHYNFLSKNFPFLNLFKNKILSFKIKQMKPSPKSFKYILQKYNLNPNECLFIDDLKENITIAESLNFMAIRYTNHKTFLNKFGRLNNY